MDVEDHECAIEAETSAVTVALAKITPDSISVPTVILAPTSNYVDVEVSYLTVFWRDPFMLQIPIYFHVMVGVTYLSATHLKL